MNSAALERLAQQYPGVRTLLNIDTELRCLEMDAASGDISSHEAEESFVTFKTRQGEVYHSLPPNVQFAFGLAMGFIRPLKKK